MLKLKQKQKNMTVKQMMNLKLLLLIEENREKLNLLLRNQELKKYLNLNQLQFKDKLIIKKNIFQYIYNYFFGVKKELKLGCFMSSFGNLPDVFNILGIIIERVL
jgi:lysyl-tRNA synthetase class I